MELISGNIRLRTLRHADREQLAKFANNKKIWNNLRNMFPHPYTVADAEKFIDSIKKLTGVEKIPNLPKILEETATPIPLPEPPSLSISELALKYKAKKTRKTLVQPHRFGTKDLEAATSTATRRVSATYSD